VKTGNLYIVATPIGNLDDITYRAVKILAEVDVIACEDTRHTRKLLDRYGIDRPAVSYHEHNEQARASELVERMKNGQSVALVSDAGSPLVSDPGYRIVRAAIDAGISVVPIPGPSAALAALGGSGLPTDAFYFGGFLPAKQNARLDALKAIADLPATLVFYEAPHRVAESLEDIQTALGSRQMTLARELTKMHEEFLRGTPLEILETVRQRESVKGEVTLVIDRGSPETHAYGPLDEAVDQLVKAGLSRMDAIKAVARQRGLSKREVYDALVK
jgi:16S rRNA (cytidine1402-2'-O)-methyltransferase